MGDTTAEEPDVASGASTSDFYGATPSTGYEQSFETDKHMQVPPVTPSSHVSSLWPSQPLQVQPGQGLESTQPDPVEHVVQFRAPQAPAVQVEPEAANDKSYLAPSVALDLEQNLTAELEDELIGALRQSVDETQPAVQPNVSFKGEAPDAAPVEQQTRFREHEKSEPAVSDSLTRAGQMTEAPTLSSGSAFAATTTPAPEESARPTGDYRVGGVRHDEPASSSSAEVETPIVAQSYQQPVTSQRPQIDENDFFAALNPVQSEPVSGVSEPETEKAGDPAGIDALFADLDFPAPTARKPVSSSNDSTVQNTPEEEPDLDDMTWPAAAAAVPQADDDETPPPPEGYDLDAVARAMQESDPSLTGAGVLPPHSPAERNAVPQGGEKSRKGLFVAAGVLGVAVLGGAGFFLFDSDAVPVPSGPPPIISGLQEPLKVYPEQTQDTASDQAGKLIYDRVDGTGVAGPDRLIPTESPQLAELPPAPVGTSADADLVPGTPKRVRTVVVRPDGTIIPEGEEPAVATPAQPQPATPVEADAASGDEGSQVVTTSPVVTGADVAPAEPADVAPALPDTPAIVTGADVAPEPAASEPVAPVPSVVPRKKPDAPVQVASAPPAATAPQNDRPLNLTQQAPAPATAAPATPAPVASTSGSIPAGTYIVQVTSQRSEAAAKDAYSGLQRRFPGVLGNRNAVIVAATVEDRGVFYRARIPTASRDEAISLCESLQAAGGDCFVRRQP
ncbi:SPOR domain-containing protein [Roseibium sp. FZY0029]|uniref:SPOR domain-containing protein n=1 Tax=Roseibium sp. FZY0029 TaxID=3116647 RepID=UPI002EA37D92|nr:SPOR domain-containing protein [Roseibium sp. FZY0029]